MERRIYKHNLKNSQHFDKYGCLRKSYIIYSSIRKCLEGWQNVKSKGSNISNREAFLKDLFYLVSESQSSFSYKSSL